MPLVRWQVEPKHVGRAGECEGGDPLDVLPWTANGTLVLVLRQLASVARCADRLFDEVGAEMLSVYSRTQRLSGRLEKLSIGAKELDAKKVTVPLGDLTMFSQLQEHYKAGQPLDSSLFSEHTRPLCVQLMYNDSLVSPVHIMREIDSLRQDGLRTSKYFVCTPVLGGGDDKKWQGNIDVEIEMRRPSSVCVVRDAINDDDDMLMETEADKDDDNSVSTSHRLPLPEERCHALSLKYPSSDIPIDVTGTGFRRMTSFRRSLIQHVEFFTRKKKKKKSNKSDRRNTISDTDDIKVALGNQKNETILSKARKRFSMAESSGSCKENIFKQAYHSLKKPSESKGVQTGEETGSEKSFASRGSRGYSTLPFRRSKDVVHENFDTESSERGSAGKSKSKSKVRKSLIPISTLSQAMSVAVKMRDGTSRNSKKEDSGQSSSGNWSASSSTRTSVESEKIRHALLDGARVPSQTSLSKDSALSDQTSPFDDMPSCDSYHSDASAGNSLKKSKNGNKLTSSRHSRIREVKDDFFANGDITDETTSTTGTLTPLLGNRALSPFDIPMAFMDDEESSVYSVDTDGYYTSMHTDSGLRSMSSSTKPLDKDSNSSSNGISNDNSSTLSSVSSLEHTENDDNKNNRHSTGTIKFNKVPPQPPKRNSSLGSTASDGPSKESDDGSAKPCSDVKVRIKACRPCPSPTSESDAEVRETFRKKTVINTSRIPSMCIVTPNPSDDDEEGNVKKDDGGKSDVSKKTNAVAASKDDVQVADLLFDEDAASGNEGSDVTYRTVPRNFERRKAEMPEAKFSTHSWPRSLTNNGLASKPHYTSVNSNIPKLSSFTPNKHPVVPKVPIAEEHETRGSSSSIPLKYVQHITVTPGGKSQPETIYASGSLDRKTSSTDKKITEISQQSKVIYATNSLERKNRPGARVTLDPSGKVVANQTKIYDCSPNVNANSIEKNVNFNPATTGEQKPSLPSSAKFQSNIPQIVNSEIRSDGDEPTQKFINGKGTLQHQPFTRSFSFKDFSNTLPRAKPPFESSPPPLNLPRNLGSSTFPRYHNNAKLPVQSKGSSSSSLDSQSSKGSPGSVKSAMPALPPPMSLLSPSKSQASRRWPYNDCGASPLARPAHNGNNAVPSLRSSNVGQTPDAKTFIPTVTAASTPATKYNNPATASLSMNTVGLPAPPAPHVYSRPAVPNAQVGRDNAYSSVQHASPYGRANFASGNRQATSNYAKTLGFPRGERTVPPYVHPPNGQNRPATPGTFSQQQQPPPPPPNRQYRLIQSSNSLESPKSLPQYSLMRTSTPVNSTTSMVPRRLEWSMNSPQTNGAVSNGQLPVQNGFQSKGYPARNNSYIGSAADGRSISPQQQADRSPNGTIPYGLTPETTNNGANRDQKPSVSVRDLFAMMQQRRFNNVRSDGEASISPVSSRSASPALSVCSQPSRPTYRESGTLSPPRTSPGDRRSWAGDSGTATLPGDRRSWAMDRLGPTKPTTLRDFKVLLLQAGRSTNVQERTARRSASEMLKVGVPKQAPSTDRVRFFDTSTPRRNPSGVAALSEMEHTYDVPTNTPPRNTMRQSLSMMNQSSMSPYGRGRMRTPIHFRTDILSMPIIEDHLEDEMADEEEDDRDGRNQQHYMEMSTDFANATRKLPPYRQNGLYKFTEKRV